MKKSKVYGITIGAVTGAMYVILTLFSNALGLSSGIIQIRISEALCIIPCFNIYAIIGLFAGCIIANFLTGALLLDVIFGSLATLIGAIGAYYLRQNKYLAVIPTIVSNTIIIPFVLSFVYKFEGAIPYFMVTVGIGEIISCGIFGIILYNFIKKHNLI